METTARSKFCRDLKLKDIKPCLRFLEKLEAVRPELAGVLHPVLDCLQLHLFKEVVDSCFSCPGCEDGEEHMCQKEMTMTYDADIKHGHIKTCSGWTFGGYSCSQTVHQRFIIKIPEGFPLEAAGPVFCAGITMYSPLVYWVSLTLTYLSHTTLTSPRPPPGLC